MDANSFLMGGGGAPTAKFPTPGTVVGGRITEEPEVQQQRDIQTGELKFWSDGNKMMQLVVTVQTDERDPAIEDDDGRRRIFVKGQMKNAVSDAVRAAGGKGLEVGGTLHVRYTHDGQPKQRGFSAPKQYAAKYEPAAVAELGAWGGAAAPAPAAAPQHQAPPAPAAAQAPADPWATATPAPAAAAAPPPAAAAPRGDEPPF
ncbi:hypothetical protein ACH4VM_02755 [Streptomyces sp. NPDC020792]|uniref:hypothetical protein n=1 Tax=Streptomyces sp. NPDC020792 TaxID=3365089 RepID=UPI0037910C80